MYYTVPYDYVNRFERKHFTVASSKNKMCENFCVFIAMLCTNNFSFFVQRFHVKSFSCNHKKDNFSRTLLCTYTLFWVTRVSMLSQ